MFGESALVDKLNEMIQRWADAWWFNYVGIKYRKCRARSREEWRLERTSEPLSPINPINAAGNFESCEMRCRKVRIDSKLIRRQSKSTVELRIGRKGGSPADLSCRSANSRNLSVLWARNGVEASVRCQWMDLIRQGEALWWRATEDKITVSWNSKFTDSDEFA